jgi:myxalamid-type polyketide synthase MxaE and MxaD
MSTTLTVPDQVGRIAIVGIGCRFPGGVSDPESFWRLLRDGVDAITEIPADRFDIERYFDERPATPGRVMSRWGGFLGPLDRFDAEFFGIAPIQAERLDPQQRLLLETTWEALEDAGQDSSALVSTPTGVFIGQWISDFESRLFANPGAVDFQMTLGSGRYAASGRISYTFGLRGPSLTIDAGCSSSLAAVHLAVRSLRAGESDLALAGGVNVILQPHIHIAYSQSRMMAADGRCKFGDALGDGYVRAEGAGVVVLKPLVKAIRDGDRVYAVIAGSAVNNDGNTSGSMGRPSAVGQEELLRAAFRDAGIAPARVRYVEAHGTGTSAGDPVELAAVTAVLSEGRDPVDRAWIGSVKTNIGHTEAAAGVAGLIKAALSVHQGLIPPSLNFVTPNPALSWDTLPVAIPREAVAWPDGDTPRIAGVSSFGIGGTNAHVVLESPPAVNKAPSGTCVRSSVAVLPLSARTIGALRDLAGAYASWIEVHPDVALEDVCCNAATRRSGLNQRVAFDVADRMALLDALRAYSAGQTTVHEGVVEARPKVAFVVPGQGGQWPGMGREMFEREPLFRAALEECDAAARRYVDWSIVDQLYLDPGMPGYLGDRIDVIQPTLVALSIAYARWLRSIGVEPDAVTGHSMGEVGAAVIAGALNVDQGMRVICARSALMRLASGQGAMAAVELPIDEVLARLAVYEGRVSAAVSNSPVSTVVSGEPGPVRELVQALELEGVFCRLVKVDVASHSRQMDPLAEALVEQLVDLGVAAGAVPIYSTVLGARADGARLDGAYWGRNLRQPVRFADAVSAMMADGISVFVELGPHPVLTQAVEQNADALGQHASAIACGRREELVQASISSALARLWVAGAGPDWRKCLPRAANVLSLPLYPWQRERHWLEATDRPAMPPSDERLIGTRVDSSLDAGVSLWPVTAPCGCGPSQLVAALAEGARQLTEGGGLQLTAIVFEGSAADAGDMQLTAVAADGGGWTLQIAARGNGSTGDGSVRSARGWFPVCRATLTSVSATRSIDPCPAPDAEIVDEECDATDAVTALFDCVVRHGSRWLGVGQIAAIDAMTVSGLRARPARVSARIVLTPHGLKMAAEASTADGICLASLHDVSVEQQRTEELLLRSVHALSWDEVSISAVRAHSPLPASSATLVVGPDRQTVEPLISALRALGQPCLYAVQSPVFHTRSVGEYETPLVAPPDLEPVIQHWAANGGSPISTVVHVPIPGSGGDADAGAPSVSGAAAQLMMLARFLLGTAWATVPRLWIVTPGVWSPCVGSRSGQGAPVWGLARAIGREHPELGCSCIDVAGAATAPEYGAAAGLIAAAAAPCELAIRGDRVFAPRFHPVPAEECGATTFRTNATYLITGGLGGVALEISRWLADGGARHIVLVGRRRPSAAAEAALTALTERGVVVRTIQADVSRRADVVRLLSAVRASMPPLAGIVHAAGTVEDALVTQMSPGQLDRVLAPKALGAWHFHEETAGDGLDFFVMCSSMAASVSQPGQAPYVAANTYLDALAFHRRASGRPALSVQWGAWPGIGMANREGTRRSARDWAWRGFAVVTPSVALASLARAMRLNAPCVLIAPVEWSVYAATAHEHDDRGRFDGMLKRSGARSRSERSPRLREALIAAQPAERAAMLRESLRQQLAAVLRLDAARLHPERPLGSLGLDSLLALEFVRRLSAQLDLKLPVTIVFNHPTLIGLEAEIARRLDLSADDGARPVITVPRDPVTSGVSVDAMSEEDAIMALLKASGTAQ